MRGGQRVRIGFLFPGQASHQDGMASAWLPQAADRFARLSEILGIELPAVADDAEACAATAIAQPAIFATSIAALDALLHAGIHPVAVAGHSLGEIAAAVAAGSIDVESAARLVLQRGRAMDRACETNPGGLAAVLGADADTVTELLATHPDVRVANDNGAGQVVIGGPTGALAIAAEHLREAGVRVRDLPVQGAFHTPAMAPVLPALAPWVERAAPRNPKIEYVSGTDGRRLVDAAQVRRALVEGPLAPVRWTAVQRHLAARDLDLLLEVGPGRVLSGLAKRALPDVPCLPVNSPADITAVQERLADAPTDLQLVEPTTSGAHA